LELIMGNERGRPRVFDREAVLDRALEVFWQHGFQSASLAELTEAMGLNKPSLYAAFGDKEALYLKALQRYLMNEIARRAQILDNEPDARTAVSAFLRSMAAMLADPKRPGGCFIINGAADCGGSQMPAAVELALRNALRGGEKKLRDRLLRAQVEGQLPTDINITDLASTFSSLLAGLAVFAKSGVKRTRLNAIITTAMAIWPPVSHA